MPNIFSQTMLFIQDDPRSYLGEWIQRLYINWQDDHISTASILLVIDFVNLFSYNVPLLHIYIDGVATVPS